MNHRSSASVDILVVDDDAELRGVVAQRLQRAGYVVETADNGRLALAFLQNRRCRLIITDLFMPEVDGIELLLAIKQYDVPVITMTGSVNLDPALCQRIARQFGAHECLLKPFPLEQLLDTVRSAIA